ncbi:MAG TPA: gamma-glutamyltransferase, partial [Verrucomicrobiae bacterium]|nr:gamma-glutamyltransferase [Verrucomicrobiae bacterium]
MARPVLMLAAWAIPLLASSVIAAGSQNWTVPAAKAAYGEHGMVATVDPLATEAAITVLKQGGNAIDATVAAALTLGVVNGYNSGIGGGCFMLIRRADGSVIAIDGRETAPAAAARDMFVRDGKADTGLSQTGALASGVPGSLAAYDYAVRKFGRKSLKELILPAAEIAERGFRVDSHYAGSLRSAQKDLARFASSRSVFLKPNGGPYVEGELLRQPDLAATYRNIAAQGVDWFYRGPFAVALEGWMEENGGVMTAEDLRGYHIVVREPL